jgi:tetratricopeptide (TPR) repeat protein
MSKSQAKGSKATPKPAFPGRWFWPALVFVLSFLMYANSLGNFYALDDDIYTRKNEYVKEGGFSSVPKLFKQGSLMGFNKQNDANYRPIVLLNFWAETAIFGENPFVNHFFNVLFWSLSCVVLYWFLLRMLRNFNPYIPLLITVLFILHPLHTDVVANIKSRDEILGFLFGMLCLLNVMKYVQNLREEEKTAEALDAKQTDMSGTPEYKYLLYSCLFLFLSVLCKENSVTLLIIIPVMIFTFTRLSIKKVLINTLPFAGVLAAYFLIRINVLSSLTFKDANHDLVNNSLWAAKNVSDMYATNFSMMGRYLLLLIFPHPLNWDYSYNTFPVVGWTNFRAFLPLLVYAALVGYAAVKVWKRDVYAFCIIFFLSTLILTSNLIVKILATFAERFLFLPSLGFCIAVVFLLCRMFSVDMKRTKLELSANLKYLLAGICILYAIATVSRIPDWKNNMSLFTSGLETQPNSSRVHFAVASENRVKGEAEGNPVVREQFLNTALLEYQRGLKIWDKDPEVYFNVGITYAAMGQTDKAIEAYNKAIELRPSYGGARNNLGVYYFNDKKYDKALECFKGVVKYDSLYTDAYANIGAVYENTGKHKEALEEFKKAIALNKDAYTVYENMSRTSASLHDSASAKDYANSASLIKDRLSKVKPMMGESEYKFSPVTKLIIVTLFCFIFVVYRARKLSV